MDSEKIYQEIKLEMEEKGIFKISDRHAARILSELIAKEDKLRKEIDKEGDIIIDLHKIERRNPKAMIHKTVIENILQLSKALGLLPLNRQRVKDKVTEDPDDIANIFLK